MSSICFARKLHLNGSGEWLLSDGMYFHVQRGRSALYLRSISSAHFSDLHAHWKDVGSGGPSPIPKQFFCGASGDIKENDEEYLFCIYGGDVFFSSITSCWAITSASAETEGNEEILSRWKYKRRRRRISFIEGTYIRINRWSPSISRTLEASERGRGFLDFVLVGLYMSV